MTVTEARMHLPAGVVPAHRLPPEARPATWPERIQNRATKVPRAIETLYCALAHRHGMDKSLGEAEDFTKIAGAAYLIYLATRSTKQFGKWFDFVIGGLAWMASMKILPLAIRGIAKAKTGIGLGTDYITSEGNMERWGNGIHYLPPEVLPLNQRLKLARRNHIDTKNPNWNDHLMDKAHSVIAQSWAAFMALAGISTPVLTATVCDAAQPALKNGYANYHYVLGQKRLSRALGDESPAEVVNPFKAAVERAAEENTGTGWFRFKNKFQGSLTEKLANLAQKDFPGRVKTGLAKLIKRAPQEPSQAERVQDAVDNLERSVFGTDTEIAMSSQWWKHFSEDVAKTLGLNKKEILNRPHEERLDIAAQTIHTNLSQQQNREAFDRVLTEHEKRFDTYYNRYKEMMTDARLEPHLDEAARLRLAQRIELAKENIMGTLRGLRYINTQLGLGETHVNKEFIKHLMANASLANIIRLDQEGNAHVAARLAGGQEAFTRIKRLIPAGVEPGRQRYPIAAKLMGASPWNVLENTLESMASHRRWKIAVPVTLGGTVLAGLAAFALVVGHDFSGRRAAE